ncbi:hypothetical protein PPROV_000904700 [Pycnococcus provasolii]|uniref:Uncharacterized protein n=1 Tax=Pycnococcus provasolii TaxID=41880 RepID=A0A830HS70_9CHLO|nr:hypothetical protein PPROV_000904700 [Pycnococcus provasolii]
MVATCLLYLHVVPDEAYAIAAALVAAAASRTAYFTYKATAANLDDVRKYVDVRPTRLKGYGAFAKAPLKKHTYLGDYEGELISNEELAYRNANGLGDYVMTCGAGAAIDGASMAADTSRFTIAHTNHAVGDAANLKRVELLNLQNLQRPRIAFFTSRDSIPGATTRTSLASAQTSARRLASLVVST